MRRPQTTPSSSPIHSQVGSRARSGSPPTRRAAGWCGRGPQHHWTGWRRRAAQPAHRRCRARGAPRQYSGAARRVCGRPGSQPARCIDARQGARRSPFASISSSAAVTSSTSRSRMSRRVHHHAGPAVSTPAVATRCCCRWCSAASAARSICVCAAGASDSGTTRFLPRELIDQADDADGEAGFLYVSTDRPGRLTLRTCSTGSRATGSNW